MCVCVTMAHSLSHPCFFYISFSFWQIRQKMTHIFGRRLFVKCKSCLVQLRFISAAKAGPHVGQVWPAFRQLEVRLPGIHYTPLHIGPEVTGHRSNRTERHTHAQNQSHASEECEVHWLRLRCHHSTVLFETGSP